MGYDGTNEEVCIIATAGTQKSYSWPCRWDDWAGVSNSKIFGAKKVAPKTALAPYNFRDFKNRIYNTLQKGKFKTSRESIAKAIQALNFSCVRRLLY